MWISGWAIFESDYLISNIDCRKTFFDLLDFKLNSSEISINKKLNSFKVGSSCFALYLGLNGNINLKNKNGWYFENYNIEKEFNNQIYLHIPTLIDATVAPKKKNIIEMGTMFPYQYKNVKDWKMVKQELTIKNVYRLERILPGIREYIDFYEAATPMTINKYTSNYEGALYGWERSPGQVFINAFPSKSNFLRNLFLTGHWTFPGGGVVAVAISGYNTAKKILQKLKRNVEKI